MPNNDNKRKSSHKSKQSKLLCIATKSFFFCLFLFLCSLVLLHLHPFHFVIANNFKHTYFTFWVHLSMAVISFLQQFYSRLYYTEHEFSKHNFSHFKFYWNDIVIVWMKCMCFYVLCHFMTSKHFNFLL